MIVKDGYTQIFSGDRQPPWFLEGDDIREVRDHDNNRWIVSVAENEIIAGFLLEPDMTMGDLVICLAEEEGMSMCPRDICLRPDQGCRIDPWWTCPPLNQRLGEKTK